MESWEPGAKFLLLAAMTSTRWSIIIDTC